MQFVMLINSICCTHAYRVPSKSFPLAYHFIFIFFPVHVKIRHTWAMWLRVTEGKIKNSDQRHLGDQRHLSAPQPTDPGLRHIWMGTICHCHPWGWVVRRGRCVCCSTWVEKQIQVPVCKCITLSCIAGWWILMSICAGEDSFFFKLYIM